MWCYQKPGFEALLLTELQRQQQHSQFCDTLLKTDGVSVPAHSCILSAISPNISSALSSMPPPPAGQSHHLEFQALGACTLLHMVRLLYSGEMAGEGEEEKQQAVSAAAKLGISGLVEVTRGDREGGPEEGEGRHTEAGVQTEPLMLEEDVGRRGRWRRQVRDGSTFLWKETLSEGEKDTWTQTEELQVNAASPSHPAASYETIDLTALQSLGQTEPHLLPPQIPYVPISLVYPLSENQTHQPSSTPMQESPAAGHTSVPVVAPSYTTNQVISGAADPQSWWAGPRRAAGHVVAAEELEDEQFEQFQGNIPGYINYFLNPDKGEHPRRGRPRKRQGAGGARRAGTGERKPRRPQARRGGRGRGGLTQTVDVQEVGVSKLQKLFLQRAGMRVPRTGQGGGAAGRKLFLKTRELLKPAKSYQRRRGRGKMWEFSPSGEVLPYSDGGAGNTQRGRRSTTHQFYQLQDDLCVGRTQTLKATPTASLSFSSPPIQLYRVHPLPASGPPPAPPAPEEQPEHFDRLLEEVMMGLNILPNNNKDASHSQPPLRASSSSCTYTSSGQIFAQNRQQGLTTGLLEAGPGLQGSTRVVTVARGAAGSSSANSEAPALQQQGDGELNEMLEHFLLSFEQHVDNCSARKEMVMGGQSCTEAPDRNSQITEQQRKNEAETTTRRSRPCKSSSVRRAFPSKNTAGALEKDRPPAKRRKRRIKNHYLFSLEKKKVRVEKPASSSNAMAKIVKDQRDRQLKLMPVVKLERSGPLPVRVKLQSHSCQSLGAKCPAKTKEHEQAASSSVTNPHDHLSYKNQPVPRGTKMYPIRSRLREGHVVSVSDKQKSVLVQEQPLVHKRSRGRPRTNGQLLSLANSERSLPPNPLQSLEACATEGQLHKNQERDEEELTVQLEEEAESPAWKGKKRGAESEKETGDDATVAKRACFEQTPQPTSETCKLSSETADMEPATTETEDVIDVESIWLTSVGDCSQREEKRAWRKINQSENEEGLIDEEVESSGDEIIDVDGDMEDDCQPVAEKDSCQSRTAQTSSHFVEMKLLLSPSSHSEVSLRSTDGWEDDKDEDIDVIGGSSPVPDPVIITWTGSSEEDKEEGDEDVDIVGEMTDYTSSAVFAAVGNGELVNRKYQTEVLLH